MEFWNPRAVVRIIKLRIRFPQAKFSRILESVLLYMGANYSFETELFLYHPPVKESEIWVTCASSSLDFPRIRSLMNFFCCISVQFLNLGRGFVVSMTKLSSLSASVIHMQYIILAVNMHSARTRP